MKLNKEFALNLKYICFNCKKEIQYIDQNKSFPFCSEKCRYIDLYNWQQGEYSVDDMQDMIILDDRETPERFWINEEEENDM